MPYRVDFEEKITVELLDLLRITEGIKWIIRVQ